MRAAILQPSYLPWLGYFEQMQFVDAFIFLDDVQYTKNDWRNRNRIKTSRGASWITVPVRRHPSKQLISEAMINNDRSWGEDHKNLLAFNYRKAPYFDEVMSLLLPFFKNPPDRLQDLAIPLTRTLAEYLGIRTPIYRSSDLGCRSADKNQRLINLCRSLNASVMYEGQSGKNYLDTALFNKEGIEVIFQNYHHPVYRQFHGEFVSHLSIVDLLFHYGRSSAEIVASGHRENQGWTKPA
jgi:hypothetical protein